jgi:hypothetical protein
MNIGVEYALKQDIKNNPVVREVDLEQKRDFFRTLGWAALVVLLLLFAAWPRLKSQQSGIKIEDLRDQQAREQALNRQYRLQLDMMRSPQVIESRAMRTLHMIHASPQDTIIIPRVPMSSHAGAIVAAVR